MSKLQPGTWYKPSNEQEWRAILDLAKSLGVLDPQMSARNYLLYPSVRVHAGFQVSQSAGGLLVDLPIQAPGFIAGMYELAKDISPVKTANWSVDREGNVAPPETALAIHVTKKIEEVVKLYETVCGKEDDGKAVGTKNLMVGGPTMRKVMDEILNHKTNKQRFADHEERIKKLELFRKGTTMSAREIVLELGHAKSRIKELEEGNVILDKEHNQYMRRTERLEAALNDHLVKERRYEYPKQPRVLKDHMGREVVFENASPKGIPFSVAMEYLKAGRRVKRALWGTPYLPISEWSKKARLELFSEDILATDWEVVSE